MCVPHYSLVRLNNLKGVGWVDLNGIFHWMIFFETFPNSCSWACWVDIIICIFRWWWDDAPSTLEHLTWESNISQHYPEHWTHCSSAEHQTTKKQEYWSQSETPFIAFHQCLLFSNRNSQLMKKKNYLRKVIVNLIPF